MKNIPLTSFTFLTASLAICLGLAADDLSNKEYDAMIPRVDVCDLNRIYSEEFTYSLPRKNLEEMLSGVAFDNKIPYTEQERQDLIEDINNIYHEIMAKNPEKTNMAVISAGAPGAGKTFLMRTLLEEEAAEGRQFAYIDPDDVCLKKQRHTYLKDIEASDGCFESHKAAYDKWRPASNAANHIILANLIRDHVSFFFGSTSSSPYTNRSFDFLKRHGYEIRLIHVTAPDDVRWKSIQKRDQTFVQTTEKDVKEKGVLVPQRLQDTYLPYASEIDFYYRAGVDEPAQLAKKVILSALENGVATETRRVEYGSSEAMEGVKKIHDEAVDAASFPKKGFDAVLLELLMQDASYEEY